MTGISRRGLLASSASTFVLSGLSGGGPAFAASAPSGNTARQPDTEWRYYAADQANTRYSPLDQINAANFNDLEIAWSFKTDALGARKEYQFEATPLLIKGRLFTTAGARRSR